MVSKTSTMAILNIRMECTPSPTLPSIFLYSHNIYYTYNIFSKLYMFVHQLCYYTFSHLLRSETQINSQYLTYFRFYSLIRKHFKVIFSFALHNGKRLSGVFRNSFFNICLVVLFSYVSASKS